MKVLLVILLSCVCYLSYGQYPVYRPLPGRSVVMNDTISFQPRIRPTVSTTDSGYVVYRVMIMDSIGTTAFKDSSGKWTIINCERSLEILLELLKKANQPIERERGWYIQDSIHGVNPGVSGGQIKKGF